ENDPPMSSLTSAPTPSKRLDKPVSIRTRLKIVMVRPRLLYPLDSGAKVHTARLLENLRRDCDVTLVTTRNSNDSDDDVAATARICKHLLTIPAEPPAAAGKRRFSFDRLRFDGAAHSAS